MGAGSRGGVSYLLLHFAEKENSKNMRCTLGGYFVIFIYYFLKILFTF